MVVEPAVHAEPVVHAVSVWVVEPAVHAVPVWWLSLLCMLCMMRVLGAC